MNSTNHFANNEQTDCAQNEHAVNEIHFNGMPSKKWASQNSAAVKKLFAKEIYKWLNKLLNDLSTTII